MQNFISITSLTLELYIANWKYHIEFKVVLYGKYAWVFPNFTHVHIDTDLHIMLYTQFRHNNFYMGSERSYHPISSIFTLTKEMSKKFFHGKFIRNSLCDLWDMHTKLIKDRGSFFF